MIVNRHRSTGAPALPASPTTRPALLVLALSLLALAGCGSNVQEKLGLGNRVPDEFQVVRRAPLVLPPDYKLRPPGSTEGAIDRSTSTDAKAIITGIGSADGASASGVASASAAERALVASARIEAVPDIRQRVLEETTQLTQLDMSNFLFILDWQRDSLAYKDEIIDPAEEAKRLADEGRASRVTTRRTGSETVTPPGTGS